MASPDVNPLERELREARATIEAYEKAIRKMVRLCEWAKHTSDVQRIAQTGREVLEHSIIWERVEGHAS